MIIIAGQGVIGLFRCTYQAYQEINMSGQNVHSFSSPKSQYKTTLPTVLNWSALHVNHFQTINFESA